MATTLSYGFVRPANGDRGTTFWDDLADDITQLNNHSHNGTDSAYLTPNSVSALSQDLAKASWVLVSNGIYSQSVTITGSGVYNNLAIVFRVKAINSSTTATVGDILLLSYTKTSATQYTVYCNDPELDLTVIYR